MGERAVDTDEPTPYAESESPQHYGTLVIRAIFEEYRAPIAARKQRRTFFTGLWIAALCAAIIFIPLRAHHSSGLLGPGARTGPTIAGLPRLNNRPRIFAAVHAVRMRTAAPRAKPRPPLLRVAAAHGARPAAAQRIRAATFAEWSMKRRPLAVRRIGRHALLRKARVRPGFVTAAAADGPHPRPALVGVMQQPNFITLTSASTHVTHGYGTTICIRVLHAKHLTLSGVGILQPNALDCRRVAPDTTTTYVVRATGFSGIHVLRTVRIFVEANPNDDLTE